MKAKNCLIFGGSGQIGRNLIRKLTSNNYKVTVVTRNIHQKSYIIKTQANAGYIDIVESNIFEEKKLRSLFHKADRCIKCLKLYSLQSLAKRDGKIVCIFLNVFPLFFSYKIPIKFIQISAFEKRSLIFFSSKIFASTISI